MSDNVSSTGTAKKETAKKETAAKPDAGTGKDGAAGSAESKPSEAKGSGGSASTEGAKSTRERAMTSDTVGFFSSVSTPEYRAGWDAIFGGGNGKANGRSAPARGRKKARPAKPRGPVVLELADADLSPELKAGLEEAFRQKARAGRRDYDRLARNRRVSWQLRCTFAD